MTLESKLNWVTSRREPHHPIIEVALFLRPSQAKPYAHDPCQAHIY